MEPAVDTRAIVERVRTEIRTRHYSPRTEDAYLGWIVRYLRYHRREPEELTVDDIRRFLSALAIEGKVSAATQNQARVLAAPEGSWRRLLCASAER